MLRFCEKRASWCYPCGVYIDSMCKKYIKREHTHVGSSSVAVSKGFYGLFKPNKNSQRCIFRFKSLQDHRFQNGNHRCWPSHMREILCILYSAFGGAKTSKNGPTKSGGMSTVTWSAWNLGCIVHGTHPNISCCRMSVSLAVFAANSDSEASRDIFGRARAPEFGSFLWHHFVHQFWGFNFFPFLFPLKWYNWKTSILRSSRSQTIKAETPVELDSAILKLYKGGLCSGTRICKTKPNQSARWLSQARPWAESEQSLPLLVAPCNATARCAARSYEHLHWGQRETDPRITMLTSFNISFQNTDSFSLPPPPFRCHPWKLVLARVHVRMKDFHPKTPRRFTLYHPWPLADSKQIEGLPPKMMCFTSHSLQSEGILNHLRRPYRSKHTSMMAMLCYQTPKMSCQ